MCLIAFAWQAHPDFPLVLIGNRDEAYERPTAPLHRWSDPAGISAGRDLRERGTWLGVEVRARMATVTNVREAHRAPRAKSRGALCVDFLQGSDSPEAFARRCVSTAHEYGPYNLLLWQSHALVHVSNRPEPCWRAVSPGVHGLSNGALDSDWPKVRLACGALRRWLATADAAADEDLFRAMQDPRRADDAQLPHTGVPLALERALSPAFIRMPGYGTRSTSLMCVRADGTARFVERTHQIVPGAAAASRELHLRFADTLS